MQYILSEEEYSDLLKVRRTKIDLEFKKLQKLCTQIADTMPIITWLNDGEPTPWGCIFTQNDWYCDKCPVREICPAQDKRWSK